EHLRTDRVLVVLDALKPRAVGVQGDEVAVAALAARRLLPRREAHRVVDNPVLVGVQAGEAVDLLERVLVLAWLDRLLGDKAVELSAIGACVDDELRPTGLWLRPRAV